MKRFVLICIFAAVTTHAIGQPEVDSIKQLLKRSYKARDTANIIYQNYSLGYYFSNHSQPDSAIRYLRKVLDVKNPVPPAYHGITLNWIGINYNRLGSIDSSLFYYNYALQAFNDANDTTGAIDVESNIAIIYKNYGIYDKALASAFNVIGRFKDRKPTRSLASSFNTIALVYLATKDHPKALEYHRKALGVRKKLDYKKGIGHSYNNLGEVFADMGNYDSALSNFHRSLSIKQSLGDSTELASTMTNIGDVLIKINKPAEAKPYLTQALSLQQRANDKQGQITTLNTLATGALARNDSQSALHYLGQGYKIAVETKSTEHLRDNLEITLKAYEMLKDLPAAMKTAKQLLIVKDSLISQEELSKVRSADLKYMATMQEQQIQLLNKEKNLHRAEIKAQRYWILALALGITFAVAIGLFIYSNFRITRKNERRVAFLLKEMHHRVKNNLQILSSVLSLQSQHLTDEQAIQAVKSNEGRINAMALIHRKLYTEETNQNINISEYISELIQYLVYTYGFHDRELKLHLNIEPLSVDVDKAIPMGLILNELISNAFKYAYATHDSPELKVALRQQVSGEVEISIQDNGSGMPIDAPTTDSEKKFGLKMINTLIKDLKGKYSVQVEQGTTYTLNIPLL